MDERWISAIDLCCGAGGWACAARGLPIRIVAAVDRWEAACRTYQRNHPQTEVIHGDLNDADVAARMVRIAREESVDLVLGAIPCEWISVRRNITRGCTDAERQEGRRVLDAVLAIIAEIGPRWWCLEDVIQIRKELPIPPPLPIPTIAVLDAAHWSAQRRRRCYFGRFPRPAPARDGRLLRDALRPGPYRIGRRADGRKVVHSHAFAADTVFGAREDRKGPTVCAVDSRRDAELVILDGDRPPRQLEWQEAAMLQGFPADYLFFGSLGDVWKMVGQAVQVDLARAILESIA